MLPRSVAAIRSEDLRGAVAARPAWAAWSMAVVGLLVFGLIYADSAAPVFTICCLTLSMSCVSFALLYRSDDTLSPAKIASLLYGISFSVAPLWLAGRGIYSHSYFGFEVRELMGIAALVTLVGYLVFLVGYAAVGAMLRPETEKQSTPLGSDSSQRRAALAGAIVVGALGVISYVGLVVRAGGLSYFVSYTGGRADIFGGAYGGWFWGAHLLFAAYGFFAIAYMRRHPILCLLLAVVLALMFLPMQGRDLVVAPFFCWVVFFHSLRRPVKWRVVILGGFIAIVLSALVGVYRTSEDRSADHGASGVMSVFAQNWNIYLTNVVAMSIEQLDTTMIAVRYVEKERHTIGPMALLSWVEPLDRQFFGDRLSTVHAGKFMDLLVYPEHEGWNTALSPSLPGELFISLGWIGILIGMGSYGAAFAALSSWYGRRDRHALMFAAYPFVLYMISKMIVDGSAHAFRPMVVFGATAACALVFSRASTRHTA